MDRAIGNTATDSGKRLPWVEVHAHPVLSFGSLVLICTLWLAMAVVASMAATVVPPEDPNDVRLKMIVFQVVAVGLALWTGGLAVRRWQERRALEGKIASMLSGESIPPQQVAELAWRRTPRGAFTPESLKALEVSWKTQLPRLWIIRPAPSGWLARALSPASAKRAAPATNASPLKFVSSDRRLRPRFAFVASLGLVLAVSGVWVNLYHPIPGWFLLSLGGSAVFGTAISRDTQWTILQTGKTLALRRLRAWRWPWEAKTATLPMLEITTDRDVLVFSAPIRRAGQQEASRWCQISLALRAVPRGMPTDFRGQIGEGSAKALLEAVADAPTVSA